MNITGFYNFVLNCTGVDGFVPRNFSFEVLPGILHTLSGIINVNNYFKAIANQVTTSVSQFPTETIVGNTYVLVATARDIYQNIIPQNIADPTSTTKDFRFQFLASGFIVVDIQNLVNGMV